MEDIYVRRILTTIILSILLVLSFFLLRPIILSIITALILAFIFSPIYEWIYKKTKMENLSAMIICVIFAILIIAPIWFLTPIFIDQSLKIYQASQNVDFVTPLKNFFPSFFASDQFSSEVGSILNSFTTKAANFIANASSNIILNFPELSMQFFVVIFTFFFVLRDGEHLTTYIKSLLPFSPDIEKRLFDSSKEITSAVIYGQVVVGVIQGIISGVGFFLFGVTNALFLTFLAVTLGILPLVGPYLVWLPVTGYMLIAGKIYPAAGVALFGIVASTIDNILRPMIISKRTKVHSSLVLIGMVGGIFLFGIIGFIIGPLILAYLIIILELYRVKKSPGFFIQEVNKQK
jgi:predicted PurR-regulated permease PerM